MKYSGLTIGVPKEIMAGECRVALSPDSVKKIVADGAKVFVEYGAGNGSLFDDAEYTTAGAELKSADEIFASCDVIMKVKEPQLNKTTGVHEADMLRKGQTIITFIHPASPVNHDMVKKLAENGVTAFTLDGIPRISRAQSMDALTSMSTVAGYKGMLMAASELSTFMPMIGTAVGMIKPAQVLVVGVGVSGLQAIATAKRLGAVVHSADIRPDASEQGASLGAKDFALGVPKELAVGEGGYALNLSEDWLDKERAKLAEIVKTMDIVFLGALVPGKRAPILITEEMIKTMKKGSVIVDISIDQGGNCECTVPAEIAKVHGVTVIGVKNIPGMMAQSSTWMFSQNVVNYLNLLVEDGKVNVNMNDVIIASSLVTYEGKIVHAGTLEAMGK